jgi:hypothetical protein
LIQSIAALLATEFPRALAEIEEELQHGEWQGELKRRHRDGHLLVWDRGHLSTRLDRVSLSHTDTFRLASMSSGAAFGINQ